MNQMLQDPQVETSKAEISQPPQTPPPVPQDPAPDHPRFAKPQRVAFVQACWHRDVVEEARIAFVKEAEARHLNHVDVFEVPGSFEIPLHAQILAKTRRYTAIVAAGLVVDGGIYRHEFVAQSVISGLMQVQLETEVPVFSVSLTPHHFHAGEEHQKFFFEHFVHKGQEAARTCADTLRKVRVLRRPEPHAVAV